MFLVAAFNEEKAVLSAVSPAGVMFIWYPESITNQGSVPVEVFSLCVSTPITAMAVKSNSAIFFILCSKVLLVLLCRLEGPAPH